MKEANIALGFPSENAIPENVTQEGTSGVQQYYKLRILPVFHILGEPPF